MRRSNGCMSPHQPLAAQLASRLLRPCVLDELLRSGLLIGFQDGSIQLMSFLGGFAVEVRKLGALAVTLNLTKSDGAPQDALRRNLANLQFDQSTTQATGLSVHGVASARSTIAEVCTTLIRKSERDLALILGHVGSLNDEPAGVADVPPGASRVRGPRGTPPPNLKCTSLHHV